MNKSIKLQVVAAAITFIMAVALVASGQTAANPKSAPDKPGQTLAPADDAQGLAKKLSIRSRL